MVSMLKLILWKSNLTSTQVATTPITQTRLFSQRTPGTPATRERSYNRQRLTRTPTPPTSPAVQRAIAVQLRQSARNSAEHSQRVPNQDDMEDINLRLERHHLRSQQSQQIDRDEDVFASPHHPSQERVVIQKSSTTCSLFTSTFTYVETGPDGIIRYMRGGSDKDGKGEGVRAFRDWGESSGREARLKWEDWREHVSQGVIPWSKQGGDLADEYISGKAVAHLIGNRGYRARSGNEIDWL
jgi:hypothetical protein